MRSHFLRAAMAGVALVALMAPATAAPAQKPAPLASLVKQVAVPYEEFTLANGLRVIVHTDRKTPVVAVSVWYGVGSGDEPQGKTGFAHLFEHLMFNGSANYDGEFFEPLDDVGATNSNGTTNVDRTNYFENVPTPALDLALFLEADRMGNLLPAITQGKLDNQRGVVQNEKRQGDNQPYGLTRYAIFEGLFPEGHPYRHSTIGSMADLDAASLADVQNWFKAYYGPNNAVLVLAGDIDAATARPMVEKRFGAIPRGPAVAEPVGPPPKRTGITRQTISDRVGNTRLYLLWVAPGRLEKDLVLIDVATTILAGGESSRLYNALVRDEQLAVAVGGGTFEQQLAGVALLTVDVKPGVDLAKVEARAQAVLDQFLAQGPTKDEIDRVATRNVAGTIRGLEQVGGFGGKAVALAEGELYANDPLFFRKQLDWYASATPKSVQTAAKRWLSDGSHRLVVQPGERGEAEQKLAGVAATRPVPPPSGAKAATDRSKLPAVTGSPDLIFPGVERAKLSNGIEVQFVRRTAVPVVGVSVSFDAGQAADARAKLGGQALMLDLLRNGTLTRSGVQIAEEAERLGAVLGSGATLDETRLSISALKPNLGASLALLADVIRNPAMAPAEIERLRAIQLSRVAQEETNPNGALGRVLRPLVFGADHPYGFISGIGTVESVKGLTREDLLAFHQKWIRPDNMKVFVAGDTTLAQVLPQLEAAFGDWAAPAGVAKGIKANAGLAQQGQGRIVLIDRPKSPQTVIGAAMPVGLKGVDDPIALGLANETLGGAFTSRLNADLREAKGWSYGVRSGISGGKGDLIFQITAPVQADRTGDSIQALVEGIQAFLGAKPITAEELQRSINANTLSLPGDYETAAAVLGAVQSNALLGRPDDYVTKLSARYRALTEADITQAAKAAIDPSKLTWVIVGDAAVVEPQLAKLGLPVDVRRAAPVAPPK